MSKNIAQWRWLLFIFAIAALVGCKTKPYYSTGRIPDDFMVALEKTPCFGTCPIFRIETNQKGECIYVGKRFVDNIGKFSKTLPDNDLAHLVELMKQANFHLYNDVYDMPGVSDVPSTSLTYRANGQTKTVTVRGGAPESLIKLLEDVQLILNDIGLEPYKEPETAPEEPKKKNGK